MGIKKLNVAVTQHNEDKLFEVWSKSMSDKSFEDWKKEIERKSKSEQQNETGGITGADLAQL